MDVTKRGFLPKMSKSGSLISDSRASSLFSSRRFYHLVFEPSALDDAVKESVRFDAASRDCGGRGGGIYRTPHP
jgi:hypothetical protein